MIQHSSSTLHQTVSEPRTDPTLTIPIQLPSQHRLFGFAVSVAARFDLGLKQFDVTNAFLNVQIKKAQGGVFCKLPDGHEELMELPKGSTSGFVFVAELEQALYGLRASPLLWYGEFTSRLRAAGVDRTGERALRVRERERAGPILHRRYPHLFTQGARAGG